MRLLLDFLIGIVTMVTVTVLGILVVQNTQVEPLYVPGTAVYFPQGLVVASAALVGFLVALLLLVPGRLASARRNRLLDRQVQLHDAHLRALREDYAQLRGGHQRLVEEHQRVMDQVLTPIAKGNGHSSAPTQAGSLQPVGTPAGAADGHGFTVKAS